MSKRAKRRRHAAQHGSGPNQPGSAAEVEQQTARNQPKPAQAAHPAHRKPKHHHEMNIPVKTLAWIGGTVGAVIIVGLLTYAIIQGGKDSGGGTIVSETPDPRLAGVTPDVTLNIEAGDAGQATGTYYKPQELHASAGQVVEIKVTNAGSVAHNLRVTGVDKEYDTADDWIVSPSSIGAGKTGTVKLKIDQPGSYPFHCDFHPMTQAGTLIIE